MSEAIYEFGLTTILTKEKILGCTITKDGKRIFEYYKNKKIADKQHKVYSCTKSVLSLLVGIAFDKGYLHDLHEPIDKYFPKVLQAQNDPRKNNITLYHLLTMTPGLHFPEWEEWRAKAPMAQGGDIIRFVLDRDLIYSPGEKMSYNSGCSHLITSILQQVTGETALQFAQKHLFQPLNISNVEWYKDNKGIYKGADGIRFKIDDMEKICLLMLQKGKWKGKQIVSEKWITQAISPHFSTYKHIGEYGLHWWTSRIDPELEDDSDSNRFHFALGHGGQYMIIVPKYNLYVTFVSELYDTSLLPLKVFRSQILKQFTLNDEKSEVV
ncbi:Beta-lactamase-related domain-containing protein OS=Ureibacillus acetophenoni OX=614649 GN=SAMN05877842_11775 PE=4 SV=1 [Ureibacillus acetophenoni]